MAWEVNPLIFACDSAGVLRHVDSVPNGTLCGCMCPACGQPLVAKNGGSVLIHHFAHQVGSCKWAAEAAVVMLAYDVLRDERRMHVESARYWDSVKSDWVECDPKGWLDVSELVSLRPEGRMTPAIAVTVIDGRGNSYNLALVVELAIRMPDDTLEVLIEGRDAVLSLDFKTAYAGMRDASGRHFDCNIFYMQVQDPDYIRSVLLGGEGSGVLSWLVHPRCDALEAEAWRLFLERLQTPIEREPEDKQPSTWGTEPGGGSRQVQGCSRAAEAREAAIAAEEAAFASEGVGTLRKAIYNTRAYVDDCPLLGRADVITDCGAYSPADRRCIFFEGEGAYVIKCSAALNGVGG